MKDQRSTTLWHSLSQYDFFIVKLASAHVWFCQLAGKKNLNISLSLQMEGIFEKIPGYIPMIDRYSWLMSFLLRPLPSASSHAHHNGKKDNPCHEAQNCLTLWLVHVIYQSSACKSIMHISHVIIPQAVMIFTAQWTAVHDHRTHFSIVLFLMVN